jgi:hypothetical protein
MSRNYPTFVNVVSRRRQTRSDSAFTEQGSNLGRSELYTDGQGHDFAVDYRTRKVSGHGRDVDCSTPPHRTVRARLRIRLPPWMGGGEAYMRIRMQNAG